ncbi:hypothetical protein NEMIN01_0468 [Nematocida minor]|uniref:uncharacterized protein n=1 Tax=Nematocida minor TaxID=1912983 RepID=UPI0022211DFF|nr:uncharacterized protein NEMIN01_0468 [Nematocida minor]KAI5189405.1 hypothetical protein NEMIN01_0468 [Nematocida minor]
MEANQRAQREIEKNSASVINRAAKTLGNIGSVKKLVPASTNTSVVVVGIAVLLVVLLVSVIIYKIRQKKQPRVFGILITYKRETLEDQLREVTNENVALTEEDKRKQEVIAGLTKKVKDYSEKIAGLNKQVQDYSEEIDNLNKQIQNYLHLEEVDKLKKQEEIDNLKKQVQVYSEEMNKLNRQIQDYSRESAILEKQEEIDNLNEQVKNLLEENARLNKKIQDFPQEIERVKDATLEKVKKNILG